MQVILTNNLSTEEEIVTTDEKKYIKAFILMYMIYIKEKILYTLPSDIISDPMNIKIGYAVSIEKMLLHHTIGTKDSFQDIIFSSGLVPKDNVSRKLRITLQGEGILPAIKKSLKLELPLRSYFVLCQLHKDYIQLTLNQVVTAPGLEENEQESVIIHDKIIPIENIYNSLCSNMWHNLVQDNSLIELCEMHDKNILDLFSLKTKTEFFINLESYILEKVWIRIKTHISLFSIANTLVIKHVGA